MNIFIDTGIYLTFFHYTNDDLEQLKKLLVAITKNKAILYLPENVISEFKRNREVKIFDALKNLENFKVIDQFPQICKEYPEYKILKRTTRDFVEVKNKLLKKLKKDIKDKNLGADKIIAELFDKAQLIKTTGKVLSEAKDRYDLGNPPGKNSSYGDAINWISLLQNVPDKEELHLIARDKDFVSKIDDSLLSDYLSDEWMELKHSKIFLYPTLSDFFTKHFPDIKLASEMEKDIVISQLIDSSNYASTHLAISKLSKFSDFSDKKIGEIIEGSVSNNQIYQIREDDDVETFFLALLKKYHKVIEPELLEKFLKVFMYKLEKSEDKDIPF